MSRSLIIIPTLNEADNINTLVEGLGASCSDATDLLFIDDNSGDETVARIREWQSNDHFSGKIALIQRPRKMGLGTAYIAGFRWALERQYDFIVTMDADGSHPTDVVPVLLTHLDRSEVVVGSRYVAGGGTQNWGLFRRILSRGGGAYARWVLGFDIRDFTAGFIAYRRDFLANLNLDDIASQGYAFQIEMKFRAAHAGYTLAEVPIIFVERTAGASKMSLKIIVEAATVVWRLAGRARHGQMMARGGAEARKAASSN